MHSHPCEPPKHLGKRTADQTESFVKAYSIHSSLTSVHNLCWHWLNWLTHQKDDISSPPRWQNITFNILRSWLHLKYLDISQTNIQCLSRWGHSVLLKVTDRTWVLNLWPSSYKAVSVMIRPTGRQSDTLLHLKQYSCMVLLFWSNIMKHEKGLLYVGGNNGSMTRFHYVQSEVRHTVEVMLYFIHCHRPDLWCL